MPASLSARALSVALIPLALGCAPPEADSLEDRLSVLEDSIADLTETLGASVDLKPGEDAFSVLRIDVGSLAITLDTIAAYGAGSQVSLTIGNLTSAQIDEISGMVWWGVPDADGTHSVAEQRSRSLTLGQSLLPGAWTKVAFALDSVPPEQIRFLRISEASATRIQLP